MNTNELYERITEDIRAGRYGKIGSRFPTLRESAEAFGVSYVTAVKVYDRLKSNGYITVKGNGHALSDVLSGTNYGKRMLIGVHVRELNNNFYSSLLNELTLEASGKNIDLVTMCSNNDNNEKRRILNRFIDLNCSGVVNFKSLNETEFVDFFKYYPLPISMCGVEFFDSINCAYVMTDDYRTGYHAAQHLINTGCRYFYSVNTTNTSPEGNQRHLGFSACVSKYGYACEVLELDENKSFNSYYDFWGTNIYNRSREVRVGVFCRHDLFAFHLFNICNAKGIKIPEEVSIIGYDDNNIAKFLNPPLSTFAYSCKRIAKALLDNLIEQIKNPSLPPRKVVIPTTMITRKSTLPFN